MISREIDRGFALPCLPRNDSVRRTRGMGEIDDEFGTRLGTNAAVRASVSKAITIMASPVRTASLSPNATCTDGLPRRISALSKQGRSSCTSDAQCISSIATAAASAR